jgi:glucoamylase
MLLAPETSTAALRLAVSRPFISKREKLQGQTRHTLGKNAMELFADSSKFTNRKNDDLEIWIGHQFQRSAIALPRAISATGLIRKRDPFRQTVIPARGSVLASPVIADWNPEPDYFFHWVRDSATAMEAVAELMRVAVNADENQRWRRTFTEYVKFSLALTRIDPAAIPRPSRDTTDPAFRKFLRSDAEFAGLSQDALLGEPRFNPDGSVDILQWSRPQLDGPALRALACLRYLQLGGSLTDGISALLRTDLAFTLRHAGEPCIGPWEEPAEHTHHYYVALVQLGALVHGKAWIENDDALSAAVDALKKGLDLHWSQRHRVYAAMRPAAGADAEHIIDAATLLAVLDADLPDGTHSVLDSRFQETQDKIEAMFANEFPINHRRPADCGPALGRNLADRYFGGGAWYVTTLAAAAIYYRRALCPDEDIAALLQRGDRFMAMVRWLTPDDGALSEQVDRVSGRQISARHLTWSYAAFVNAACLRHRAIEKLGSAH